MRPILCFPHLIISLRSKRVVEVKTHDIKVARPQALGIKKQPRFSLLIGRRRRLTIPWRASFICLEPILQCLPRAFLWHLILISPAWHSALRRRRAAAIDIITLSLSFRFHPTHPSLLSPLTEEDTQPPAARFQSTRKTRLPCIQSSYTSSHCSPWPPPSRRPRRWWARRRTTTSPTRRLVIVRMPARRSAI